MLQRLVPHLYLDLFERLDSSRHYVKTPLGIFCYRFDWTPWLVLKKRFERSSIDENCFLFNQH